MVLPPRFSVESTEERFVNVDRASGASPALTPGGTGRGNGDSGSREMTLADAQKHVDLYHPHTVQGLTREQGEAVDRLCAEAALRTPATDDQHREPMTEDEVFRNKLAYEQGRLQALQEQEWTDVPQDMRFMTPQNDREQASLNKGYEDMGRQIYFSSDDYWRREAASIERAREQREAEAKEHHIPAAASMQQAKLVTSDLNTVGQTVKVSNHATDGTTKTHTYELARDRVIHTAPDGKRTTMTFAAAQVAEADHSAKVNQNTAQAIERMKTDRSFSAKAGKYTYSVEGDNFVRKSADGEKRTMPLAQVEENLAKRQEQIQKLQKNANSELYHDNKQRKEINKTLVEREKRGDKTPIVTYDHKREPTTWTRENGELMAQKGVKADQKTKEKEPELTR